MSRRLVNTAPGSKKKGFEASSMEKLSSNCGLFWNFGKKEWMRGLILGELWEIKPQIRSYVDIDNLLLTRR